LQANHDKIKKLLLTAKGQMDGLIKMVDEDRYCVDISNQLSATAAILKTANREVLAAHMKGCVVEACESGDIDEKIAEITRLLDKWMK
jgi:Uncharacterized protein conserved in bacteria